MGPPGARRHVEHRSGVDVAPKEASMGLFEAYPWLLVPIIIVTMEGWSLLKGLLRAFVARRRAPQSW
jgi:hypothetical protein